MTGNPDLGEDVACHPTSSTEELLFLYPVSNGVRDKRTLTTVLQCRSQARRRTGTVFSCLLIWQCGVELGSSYLLDF